MWAINNKQKTSCNPHRLQRMGGFTIVELLIVIVVIAILATITIVAYNGIQNRAKATAAQAAASQAAKKLLTYAVQNSDQYPADLATAGIIPSGDTTFQYSVNNSTVPRTFCVTTTVNDSVAYFVSNAATQPASGVCPGHDTPGAPAITNLVGNPSLETSAAGWTTSSVSLNPTRVQVSGKWVFSGTRTDTAAVALRGSYALPSTVTVGNTYTASALVTSSAARTFTLGVRQAGTATTIFSADHVFAAGETKRISVTGVTTVGSVYINLLNITGSVGDTYTIDELMLTEGSTVYNYADGDSAGWVWNGTTGESTSTGSPL